MLFLVGLVVGGIDVDGVGFHAFPVSLSEETLTRSSSVQSSLSGLRELSSALGGLLLIVVLS